MKRIMIAAMIVMLMLFAMGCVSASDDGGALSSDEADIQSSNSEIEDFQLEIGGSDDSEIVGNGGNQISFKGTTMTELSNTIGSCQNDDVIYLENDIIQDYFGNGTTSGLSIKKQITIDGKGHTINLQGRSQAFVIRANDVLLRNIIFKNGYGENGGVIQSSSDGSCTLVNCTFIDNNANYGGAVYLKSANNRTMVNCTFINNSASMGGAIYAFNEINLEGCTFCSNVAERGGVYIRSGPSNVNGCIFTGNNATTGAAIYSYSNNQINLEGCTFRNNFAENGGVYIYSGFCNVNDCIFTGNTARQGAAIYSQACNITNSYFADNNANSDRNVSRGSALYINGVSYLANCYFINNYATSSVNGTYGGAIYVKYGSDMINCTFANNTAKTSGAAIYSIGTILKLDNCTFTENLLNGVDAYGGAVYSWDCNITNCNFINNTATHDGGAIYLYSGSCELSNNIFVNNIAQRNGGAVYSYTHINVYMCNFTNNVADSGGAICASLDLSDCNFINNYATSDGGAINAPVPNKGVTFYFNINNALFINNTANRSGGSVIGYGDINNCSFINSHTSTHDGGAVYLRNSSSINNCVFDTASARDGGVIYSIQRSNVNNCNFINASASRYGGALYKCNAYDCYFVNCSAANKGSGIYNGNAYDSTFINCYNANSIVFNGTYQNCIFMESPVLYCPDVTVGAGETAVLPVRILDINGIDINGVDVNVEVYKGNAVIDSFTTQSGYNLALSLDEGSYIVALTSRYIKPVNARLTVNSAKPSPFISAPSATALYGEDAVITVYLASDVPGNVKVTVNGVTEKAKITNGVARYTVSGLNSGSYAVVISYGGNYKYAEDSIRTTLQVNKNSPILSVGADDSAYGENAIVTVNLAPNVAGNIHITVNGVTQKAKIANNVATATFTNLKPKTYDVSARYGGNVNYVAQTATATLTVVKGTPIISVDAPDAVFGTDATITVNLFSDVPGNVRVAVNGVSEKAKISNGRATYNVSGLKSGSYAVTVTYAGNVNYNAQTFTATLNIVKATPITSVSVENIHVGDDTVVTVNLFENANGFVRITVNGVTERVQIVNGIASASFSNLKAGSYDVSAVYGGSANFNAQTATANFSVDKNSPGLTVAKRTVDGKTVLIANIAEDASGNVNFAVNGGTYKAKIVNGVATVTLPDFEPGTYTLKTSYGGNYKYLSESKTRTITIK